MTMNECLQCESERIKNTNKCKVEVLYNDSLLIRILTGGSGWLHWSLGAFCPQIPVSGASQHARSSEY